MLSHNKYNTTCSKSKLSGCTTWFNKDFIDTNMIGSRHGIKNSSSNILRVQPKLSALGWLGELLSGLLIGCQLRQFRLAVSWLDCRHFEALVGILQSHTLAEGFHKEFGANP